MVVMEQCSSQPGVLPITPRLDLYDIVYDDDEEKAKLPRIFSKKYYANVPNRVILTDPTGKDLEVFVIKENMETYFGHGWKDVGVFYGIKPGGWVRMFYVASGHFSIHVFNQWGDPVIYHSPAKVYEKGDCSHPIILDEDTETMEYSQHPQIVDLSNCISEFQKWLSYEEIVGNRLCFCKSWTSYALPKKDGKVTIVDEYGYTWPCVFKHNVGDPNKSGITQGWSTFCHNKKLFQSQCVKFGVLQINSNVLYFTPSF